MNRNINNRKQVNVFQQQQRKQSCISNYVALVLMTHKQSSFQFKFFSNKILSAKGKDNEKQQQQ